MTDPLRSDRPASSADLQERDRDARVEHLLLAGLDHYFAGQYELAISVWTRVLFLNHGHARARAYMERARSAISERQRESEELLHTGVEAFGRGDIVAARRLLTSAVERGAGTEEALALLDRLNRLEPAVSMPGSVLMRFEDVGAPILDVPAVIVDVRPSRVRWVAAGVAAGVVVAAAAAWLWFRGADAWLVQATTPARAAVAPDAEPLPVPAASEASMSRARALQAKGRLHEALVALDGIPHGDILWLEAQTLRAAIQRQLLAGAGTPLPGPDGVIGQGSRQ
jgi:tetratricopeptide (TPR) repeat protein